MKVIGTGFGRTGTMSLKIALEKLGFGPLCEFLDVDIPESIPFPKVNDTAEMLRKFAIIKSLPYLFILFMVGISVLLLRLI